MLAREDVAVELPVLTRTALSGLRRVEDAAAGPQVARARAASARLLRALVDAGWPVSVLVEPMGRTDGTIRRRVARQPPPTGPPGVQVPSPPQLPRRIDRAVVPLDQRQWLRPVEAAELMAVHTDTVSRWRLAGLLPHTIRRANNTHLFSRADLLVVVELRAGRGNVPIQKARDRSQ